MSWLQIWKALGSFFLVSFLTEGWILKIIFKMWRKTSTLRNFVLTKVCWQAALATLSGHQRGWQLLGARWQEGPRMVVAGSGSHSLFHPQTGALEQPQSQALAPPWRQGPGDRHRPPQPGWYIMTNLILIKNQTKQLTYYHSQIKLQYVGVSKDKLKKLKNNK